MDRHVAEDAARACDVIRRWRAGVAAGDGYHFNSADGTVVDRGLYGHEIRVKAAVEADHDLALVGLNRLEAGLHAGQRQIDRLFAEHRLSG